MRVITFSLSAAGADLARRLPWEHRHGGLMAAVSEEWSNVDGMVIIAATGIAVRAIAPHLSSKLSDPAVVALDDAGRHAVVLTGGHAAGGNDLAAEVGALLGATPVVSTATDLAGIAALDRLPGFEAEGDIALVTRAWLDGRPPRVRRQEGLVGWPLPAGLPGASGGPPPPGPGASGGGLVSITDAADTAGTGTDTAGTDAGGGRVWLRPRSLVIGVGASRNADPADLAALVQRVLHDAGRHPSSVGAVATIDLKRDEPAIKELAAHLGVALVDLPAAALRAVVVPNPSEVVEQAVGTPSVAEAAALAVAGPGSRLVAEKQVSDGRDSTVALARRAVPAGHLALVGLGPGRADQRTPEAAAAVRHAEMVIGYGPYVDQARDLLGPAQEVVRSPIGAETERCRSALEAAAAGRRVALVCSGDAGVYAMASLACELAPTHGDPPITVVPGVTAALAAAAVLGAPLGHDHASISLSDLLTPWPVIRRRIEAVAEADFVVSLYNPRSQKRTSQLEETLAILLGHRPGSTPAAVVTDAGRAGQSVWRGGLADLDPIRVGMLSIVTVGSTETRWIGPRMVTPRGYPG